MKIIKGVIEKSNHFKMNEFRSSTFIVFQLLVFSITISCHHSQQSSQSTSAKKVIEVKSTYTDKGDSVELSSTRKSLTVSSTIPVKDFINQLNPEQALLLARLVRIIPITEHVTDFPCNTYPCWAEVDVIEVLARGSTYPGKAEGGMSLLLYFPMTLNPSDEVFQGKSPYHFDGLSKGAIIRVVVTGQQSINGNTVQHTVDQYTNLK